ncbi:hypothetical protein CBF34_05030 [Vagococcus penaei]|uniref:muramidase family protein n=1 Tax=Vagococcus penaei TaxID=633807 RepID=UPI000F893027|nr:LysM peptidoglycan-binding domain-containing protein [Vagococcus penaei]RSU02887.1 hypothetical protein CBF34_05030 [Vagococcus penaei]
MGKKRNRKPIFGGNVTLLGTTVMLSSLMAMPLTENIVYATGNSEKKSTDENQTINRATLRLTSLNGPKELSATTANQVDLVTELMVTGEDKTEFMLTISPNIAINESFEDGELKDKTGAVIGEIHVNRSLNQIKMTLNQNGTYAVSLNLPLNLKNQSMAQQTITVSAEEQRLSHVVSVLNQQVGQPAVSEDQTETNQKSSESSVQASTLSTSTEISSEHSSSSTKTSETTSKATTTSSTKNEASPSETQSSQTMATTSSTNQTKQPTSSTTTSSATKETKETKETRESNKETTQSKPATKPKVTVKNKQAVSSNQIKKSVSQPQPQTASLNRQAIPQNDFVGTVAPYAQQVAAQNDLYASVMIAQSILESGYGQSTLSQAPNFNLFGIKGQYQGQSVRMLTWEHYNGKNVQIYDNFRKYPSYAESFQDNARVLRTTSFYPGVYFYAGAWKSNTTSYRDATAALTGKYATDPNYNNKLNNLIQMYNLTQYDSPSSGSGEVIDTSTKPTTPSNDNSSTGSGSTNTNVSQQTYTVQRGDTLYAISRRYNVSVGNLMSWNGLTNHMIYPGQKLVIKGSTISIPNQPETKPEVKPQEKPSKPNQPSGTNESQKVYTVKSGDTLSGIGRQFGVSVANLKSWNGLTSDMIYVNQQLVIKGQNGTQKPQAKPQPKPTKPSQPAVSSTTYQVKSGDTLYGISRRYGVSVSELKSWNGLTNDLIYVGQGLTIKGVKVQSKPQSQATVRPTVNQGTTTYQVKSGDTLYHIGLAHGLTVSEIKAKNGLTSDLIYVGQKLVLKTTEKARPQTTVQVGKGQMHKVQRGETLWALAQKYQTSVSQIKTANRLSSDIIYPGQLLKVK